MRGKAYRQKIRHHVSRITPAYAGKRETLMCAAGLLEDHPRLCGEKHFRNFSISLRAGSPPPMRGKVLAFVDFQFEFQDHPRLCGEKRFPCNHHRRGTGSPPPMRGKANSSHTRRCPSRITPAYAGKSNPSTKDLNSSKDHPRLCGEKLKTAVKDGVYTGSPPPMRGKVERR